MSPASSNLCNRCNKATATHCARCKSAHYCSKTCQKSDWSIHKLLCKALSTFDTSTQPQGGSYVKAIFFPEAEKRPKLIWLSYSRFFLANYESTDYRSLIGESAHTTFIDYSEVLNRNLPNAIAFAYRDYFLSDGSKANSSIRRLTAENPGYHYDWRGPLIFYAKRGPGSDYPYCKDITMDDFCHIADYLMWYNFKSYTSPAEPGFEKIKAIRINCDGDRVVRAKPRFETVEVLSLYDIFTEHETSDIADLVGLPLSSTRLVPDSRWANNPHDKAFSTCPFTNLEGTYLHVCCKPESNYLDSGPAEPSWGWPGQEWHLDVGSVLVVRQDKKPLSALTVEALYKYCNFQIYPLLKRAEIEGLYSPEDSLSTEAVLAVICRPTFSAAFESLADEKRDNNEEVDDTDSYSL